MGVPAIQGLDNGFERLLVDGELAGLAGLDSLVLNGNFPINQRAVSGTVTLAAGAYGHDRWLAGSSGCTYTFATSGPDTVLTITAGSLEQIVDGSLVTSGDYTLSWFGTAQGGIGPNNASPSAYTVSPLVASGITAGQPMRVAFGTGTLGFISLVRGKAPAPATLLGFRRRFNELYLCRAAFWRMLPGGPFGNFGSAVALSTTQAIMSVRFLRTMAKTPTLTAFATNNPGFYLKGVSNVQLAASAFSLNSAGPDGAEANIAASGLTAGQAYAVNAYNDATARLDFSADA